MPKLFPIFCWANIYSFLSKCWVFPLNINYIFLILPYTKYFFYYWPFYGVICIIFFQMPNISKVLFHLNIFCDWKILYDSWIALWMCLKSCLCSVSCRLCCMYWWLPCILYLCSCTCFVVDMFPYSYSYNWLY